MKLTLQWTNDIHNQFITKYLLEDLRTIEQNYKKPDQPVNINEGWAYK